MTFTELQESTQFACSFHFATEAEVREYFTRDNMVWTLGACPFNDDQLKDMADIVIKNQWHCDFDTEFKMVDVFNGWEGEDQWTDREQAEIALDVARHEFYTHAQNRGCTCKLTIIPAHWEWYHNGIKFVWG